MLGGMTGDDFSPGQRKVSPVHAGFGSGGAAAPGVHPEKREALSDEDAG